MDNRRILLIDDDQEVLVAMSKFLERRGFAVVTAGNATTAMETISGGLASFDAVLTDLEMRQFNGLEILKAVKQVLPELPVILVCGYGDPETLADLGALGAADLLHKPFTGDRLLNSINRATGRPPAVELSPALT